MREKGVCSEQQAGRRGHEARWGSLQEEWFAMGVGAGISGAQFQTH